MEFPWMLPTIILAIGMVIFYLGYSIRVNKNHHLIAGFKESQLRDKTAIANRIGEIEMFGGFVNIVLGILAFYVMEWSTSLFVIGLFCTILTIIVAAFAASPIKPNGSK